MNIDHRYIITGILLIAIIITGTTAYDSITADRSVDVSVVENEGAYLAIETQALENGSVVPAFTFTNNLSRDADLTVEVTNQIEESGASVDNISVDGNSKKLSEEIDLSNGETAELNIECSDASKSYNIGLQIILETTNIEIDVEREYTLECNT